MITVQSPLTGDQKLRPKSGRIPLQPKNSRATANANPITEIQILKPKQKLQMIEISVSGDPNKENRPIYATPTKLMEQLDASLAEELSAIRKKIERLRIDKERTEKLLKERAVLLDLEMKEIEERGEDQKRLEIEVDRLYRLKQLQSNSMRISPIRSLRDKEEEKKIAQVHLQFQFQEMKTEDLEESVTGSTLQSPSSSSSSNSVSSQLVTAK